MPGPLVLAGIGVGVGLINSLVGLGQQSAEEDRIKRIQAALEETKITSGERDRLLDHTSDKFNTNILENLNTSSIGLALSGVSNPEIAQGVTAGQMLGERQEALLDQENYVRDFNSNVDLKQAEVETQSSAVNLADNFLTGGLAGIQTALNIEDLLNSQKDREELMVMFGSLINN